jgi:hypothetical protein
MAVCDPTTHVLQITGRVAEIRILDYLGLADDSIRQSNDINPWADKKSREKNQNSNRQDAKTLKKLKKYVLRVS